MQFTERIKQLREERQMPQRQFAAALEIDTATYCKIEKGERRVKAEQVVVIANLLKTDKDELLALWLADQVAAVVVRNAKANELPALLAKAKQSSFLSYRVNKEQFNDFETLNENEQRTLLLQLVDANMLYVNYSDLENKDYDISEEDKKLNKQFYGK